MNSLNLIKLQSVQSITSMTMREKLWKTSIENCMKNWKSSIPKRKLWKKLVFQKWRKTGTPANTQTTGT